MSTVVTQAETLFNAALELPEAIRAELAERLIASLGKPPGVWSIDDPGFGAELDRRIDELESGKVQTIEWSVVKQEINEMLQQKQGA